MDILDGENQIIGRDNIWQMGGDSSWLSAMAGKYTSPIALSISI